MKPDILSDIPLEVGRAPRGARGLKLGDGHALRMMGLSRPARGAWIETAGVEKTTTAESVAPRAGRVD